MGVALRERVEREKVMPSEMLGAARRQGSVGGSVIVRLGLIGTGQIGMRLGEIGKAPGRIFAVVRGSDTSGRLAKKIGPSSSFFFFMVPRN